MGGGVVGTHAARMALGMGANVTILDRSINRLRYLEELFNGNVKTLYSTHQTLQDTVYNADLVVGAVLIAGASAPKLVTRSMLKNMRQNSVIVDVAIDQGGCFETSTPTTHSEPTYIIDEIVHYCVANMPGAVARTSTLALSNATLPFIIALANDGYQKALKTNSHLKNGLNVCLGNLVIEAVATELGFNYLDADEALQL